MRLRVLRFRVCDRSGDGLLENEGDPSKPVFKGVDTSSMLWRL